MIPITYYTFHETFLGKFALAASDKGLMKVNLPGTSEINFKEYLIKIRSSKLVNHKNKILLDSCSQLDEYLDGKRRKFEIPLDISDQGTEFQTNVWSILSKIPYGKTLTYKDVAKKLNNLGAVRAVGQANKSNPIAIFIPCHRVIGSNKGNLGGYAGNDPKNINLKKKILNLESTQKLDMFLI